MKLSLLACLCLFLDAALCLCPITLRADTVLVGLADTCELAPCLSAHATGVGAQFTLTTTSYAGDLLVENIWAQTPQLSTAIQLSLTGSSIHVQTEVPGNIGFGGPAVLGIDRVLPAGNYIFGVDGLGGVMGFDPGNAGPFGCCGFISGITTDGGGMPAFELDGEPVSSTPEPSTLLMLGSGLLGLAGVIRRNVAKNFRATSRQDALAGIR